MNIPANSRRRCHIAVVGEAAVTVATLIFFWTTTRLLGESTAEPLPYTPMAEQIAPESEPVHFERELLSEEMETGRRLLTSDRLACRGCHSLTHGEESFGPDLSDVGRRLDRDQIIQAILDPNSSLAEGFRSERIETEDGRLLSGQFVAESEDSITLRLASGDCVTIARPEIAARQQATSDMPEGLVAELTEEEFHTLVSYLTTLRGKDVTRGE